MTTNFTEVAATATKDVVPCNCEKISLPIVPIVRTYNSFKTGTEYTYKGVKIGSEYTLKGLVKGFNGLHQSGKYGYKSLIAGGKHTFNNLTHLGILIGVTALALSQLQSSNYFGYFVWDQFVNERLFGSLVWIQFDHKVQNFQRTISIVGPALTWLGIYRQTDFLGKFIANLGYKAMNITTQNNVYYYAKNKFYDLTNKKASMMIAK